MQMLYGNIITVDEFGAVVGQEGDHRSLGTW